MAMEIWREAALTPASMFFGEDHEVLRVCRDGRFGRGLGCFTRVVGRVHVRVRAPNTLAVWQREFNRPSGKDRRETSNFFMPGAGFQRVSILEWQAAEKETYRGIIRPMRECRCGEFIGELAAHRT